MHPDSRISRYLQDKNTKEENRLFAVYATVMCVNVVILSLSLSLSLSQRRTTDECYFLERLESNNYNTYRSRKYPDWYVALKRTGQYKAGSKTGPGQKAILFLPMTAKC
uniref:Fibroblast growth factor 2 n=1 Tax=Sinocyclocheilus anshuiensis TaxID=1608454 RepID=A0A671NBV8_9TELE